MWIAERQNRLQELLARRGLSDLETLARELNVSQSTVRRDLDLLVRRGLVSRTHGGAVWVGDRTSGARPYEYEQRVTFRQDAKLAIARAARALVQPGQTILLDGGTTTYYLARELVGMPLQLVTNSLPIAGLFLSDDSVELVVTGGLMYPRYGVLLGPLAESFISSLHSQTLFLSVAGLHDGSLYNQNLLLVKAEQRMMEQAQQTVLLVDSTKFGQQALARLCGLDDIDIVVTDAELGDEHRRVVERAGCQLILAR